MATLNGGSAPIIGDHTPLIADALMPHESLRTGENATQNRILSTYTKIEEFNVDELKVEVIDSGFRTLDDHKVFTENEGRIVALGAYTSHGKTALMMQIAAHISKKYPVIIHSFEMTKKQLVTRLISSATGISMSLIRKGIENNPKIKELEADFRKRKLYLANVRNRTTGFVIESIYQMAQAVGQPGLIVIDYGQQLTPGGDGRQNRVAELSSVSAGLMTLSEELKCNILVGLQLNNRILDRSRTDKDEDGKRSFVPEVADIRETTGIACDADTVLMLVRKGLFDRDLEDRSASLWGPKTRNEPIPETFLEWDGPHCRFIENYKEGL